MSRQRLPNRRPNKTLDLEFDGHLFQVTIGYSLDGEPKEVFCHGAKAGSALDFLLDDACVILSLLLQHGSPPEQLHHSMGKFEDGNHASIIGAVVELLSTSNHQQP